MARCLRLSCIHAYAHAVCASLPALGACRCPPIPAGPPKSCLRAALPPLSNSTRSSTKVVRIFSSTLLLRNTNIIYYLNFHLDRSPSTLVVRRCAVWSLTLFLVSDLFCCLCSFSTASTPLGTMFSYRSHSWRGR